MEVYPPPPKKKEGGGAILLQLITDQTSSGIYVYEPECFTKFYTSQWYLSGMDKFLMKIFYC